MILSHSILKDIIDLKLKRGRWHIRKQQLNGPLQRADNTANFLSENGWTVGIYLESHQQLDWPAKLAVRSQNTEEDRKAVIIEQLILSDLLYNFTSYIVQFHFRGEKK